MDKPTPVTDALLKDVKPIARFGKYEMENPVDFIKWLQSPEFKDFWAKDLTPEQIGIRSEINDSRYGWRQPRSYASEMAMHEKQWQRRVDKGIVTPEQKKSRLAYQAVGNRAAGRFYTPLSDPSAIRFYVTPESLFGELPMRVIADKDLQKFSLKGYKPYHGYIDTTTTSHQDAMSGRANFSERQYGKNLGATLSSNPEHEVFVNNKMAKPVSQGGRSRSFGTVIHSEKSAPPPYRYVVYGMPKTSVPMQYAQNAGQVAKNIVPTIGAAMNSPLAGGIGGVLSIGGQIYDANSDNFMDRNYRMTDPLSVRPFYDLVLDGFSGDARRSYERLVSSPEYVERNPLSSMVGQAVRGNPEYLKAFFQAYNPF